MEGAGIITLAVLLFIGVPYALVKLLVLAPYHLFAGYNNHFSKLQPREAALQEAAHGAAMIILPVLALLRFAAVLPPWSSVVVLVLIVVGGLRLNNGAKFSVGWRDPKLIARAALKIVLAVLLFRALDAGQLAPAPPMLNPFLSLIGWWLLVTGLTKLLLVLRGQPAPIVGTPGTPHGNADFWKPKGSSP